MKYIQIIKIEYINSEKILEEKEILKKKDPIAIINYIKNSIDILVDLKVEEKIAEQKPSSNDNYQDYETLLRKLENDIRTHIKVIFY